MDRDELDHHLRREKPNYRRLQDRGQPLCRRRYQSLLRQSSSRRTGRSDPRLRWPRAGILVGAFSISQEDLFAIVSHANFTERALKAQLALAALIALAPTGKGEDWPQFLGPRSNNTSMETGLLDKWPMYGPTLVWEKDIGA